MAVPPEDRTSYKEVGISKMLGRYIDNCIRIFLVVFIADFLQRLFYVLNEYFRHGHYYLLENRLTTIIRRTYSYDNIAILLYLVVAVLGFARFGSTNNLTQLLPNSAFLAYVPLYWLFSWAQLSHSTLKYAHWIRDPHGLDYAAGMASNYFHGYLKLSLPERNKDGLKNRMQAYEDTNNVVFGLDRLIILLPDEMFVKGVIDSELLEKAEPLETQFINRAGVNRPFKHAVYRLTEQINGTFYYFAMEGATPMLSFFEAMHFQRSATWQMHEMKREIWLKFYKHLNDLLNTWPETRREVELIIYNSHKENGDPVDVGNVLLAHVRSQLEKNKKF